MTYADWILLATLIVVIWYSWETKMLRIATVNSLAYVRSKDKKDRTLQLMSRFSEAEIIRSRRKIIEHWEKLKLHLGSDEKTRGQFSLDVQQEKFYELRFSMDLLLDYFEVVGSMYKADLIDRRIAKAHLQILAPDFHSKFQDFILGSRVKNKDSWSDFTYLAGELSKKV